jgi:hypothetical protein
MAKSRKHRKTKRVTHKRRISKRMHRKKHNRSKKINGGTPPARFTPARFTPARFTPAILTPPFGHFSNGFHSSTTPMDDSIRPGVDKVKEILGIKTVDNFLETMQTPSYQNKDEFIPSYAIYASNTAYGNNNNNAWSLPEPMNAWSVSEPMSDTNFSGNLPPGGNKGKKIASSSGPKKPDGNNREGDEAEQYEKEREDEFEKTPEQFVEAVRNAKDPSTEYVANSISRGNPNAMSEEDFMKLFKERYYATLPQHKTYDDSTQPLKIYSDKSIQNYPCFCSQFATKKKVSLYVFDGY